MGYSTDFRGHLTISPPLPAAITKAWQHALKEGWGDVRDGDPFFQTKGHPTPPDRNNSGFSFDFEPVLANANDGTAIGIKWDGSEKTYYAVEWIQWFIDAYVDGTGCEVSGQLYAEGEDPDDRWFLRVTGGKAERVEAVMLPADTLPPPPSTKGALEW